MEDEIKTHSAKSCSLPQNITQSITDDIKDVVSLFFEYHAGSERSQRVIQLDSLFAQQLSASIINVFIPFPFPIVRIEPSLTRFTNVPNPLSSPKLIRRAEPLSSEYERQRTLKSMSEAERESLLSESVQIEVCALFCA